MADSYRGHSRRSDTPSSSSSGSSHHGQSNLSYPASSSSYSYYAAPALGQQSTQYGQYSASSQHHTEGYPSQGYGHHRTSSGHVHSSYPSSAAAAAASERASKRQRASAAHEHDGYAQTQWTEASAHGHHSSSAQHASRGYATSRSSRAGDHDSPSGYSYRNPHDPYGQQLMQPSSAAPGVGPSTSRDAHLYSSSRHSQQPSSDDEQVEHGPTELPPRKYSGKSQYDLPKKPGKIPGSAMDYLPILEARFDRLETAIDKYVDYRGQRALSNSILPGLDESEGSSSPEGSSKYSSSRRPGTSSRR